MMYNVQYLPLAEEDVLEAVRYIAERLENPAAASALLDELDEAADGLSRFPYMGSPYHTDRPMRDELRMLPVKNYVLYYTVTEEAVEIRRFIHGKRDRSKLDWE